MSTFRLQRLRIDRVGLVDEPASQKKGSSYGAFVTLFKRAEPAQEKRMDLSKLSPEDRKAVEDLQKSAAETAKELEALKKAAPAKEPTPEDVLKSLPEAARKAIEAIQKQAEDAQKRAEAAEKAAAVERDARELDALAKRVGVEMAGLSGKAEDIAGLLHRVGKVLPEDRKALETLFKGWAEQAKKGSLFRELGQSGDPGASTGAGMDALDKARAMAKERVAKAAAGSTTEDAELGKVFTENPELYAQYQAEARRAARVA